MSSFYRNKKSFANAKNPDIMKIMEHIKLSEKDHEIIFIKTLSWIVLATLGFVLALTGIFYWWIIASFFLIGLFFLIKYSLKRKLFTDFSRELAFVGIGIFAVVCFFAFFSSPTVFSGRDQGAISEAAIRLVQNHKLEFSTPAASAFFKIYGQGKALNFPGFYYTPTGQLIVQFPLIYISWLAIFYAFFGLTGFILANIFLLFSFTLTFYALARHYFTRAYSLLAIIFVLTSFSFSWFLKFTLSENMALPLLWVMIFMLIKFLEKQSTLTYTILLLSGSLLVFTRIEGIAFFAITILLIFLDKKSRYFFTKNYLSTLVLPFLGFLFIAGLNFTKNIYFYKEVVKAFLNSLPVAINPSDTLSPTGAITAFYPTQLFFLYGIISFLILGFFGVVILFVKKNFKVLIAFFVVLPSLIYLIEPHISSDHPWTLRRYLFSILPSAILYTTFLLSIWGKKLEKKESYFKIILPIFAAIIIVILNLPAFFRFATYSENTTLLLQTKEFSKNFTKDDLVLIDRNVTGDGWTMLTGPMSFLYGKNTAYFFNTNDLAKLDLKPFKNVYLITPDNHKMLYTSGTIEDRLIPFKKYSLNVNHLELGSKKSSVLVSFPKKISTEVSGEIYLIKK